MIYFSCFLCFLAASFERSQHFGDTPAKHLEACDMREQQEEESFLRVAKFWWWLGRLVQFVRRKYDGSWCRTCNAHKFDSFFSNRVLHRWPKRKLWKWELRAFVESLFGLVSVTPFQIDTVTMTPRIKAAGTSLFLKPSPRVKADNSKFLTPKSKPRAPAVARNTRVHFGFECDSPACTKMQLVCFSAKKHTNKSVWFLLGNARKQELFAASLHSAQVTAGV